MRQVPRRHFLLVAGAFIAAPFAEAQTVYPSRPVRIVVGFPPGGATDNLARLLAEKAASQLGQPVIVDNKPGAGAIIAAQHVANAAADGYTLFLTLSGALINNTALYRSLPYNPGQDFTYIAMLGTVTVLIAVHKSVPVSNLKEFIAYARSGHNLNFGSWAPGSHGHILCWVLNKFYQLSLGPAGMAHDAGERRATIVREFLELPDVRQRFDTYGFEPKFVPTEAFFRTWQLDSRCGPNSSMTPE